MFKYLDKDGRNADFSIDDENTAVLKIGGYEFEGMQIPARDIDLSQYRGSMVRIYIDKDGSYSTAHGTHEWLLIMGRIPEPEYKSVYGGKDENGQTRMVSTEVPLDLNNAEFTVFALPEQEKQEG